MFSLDNVGTVLLIILIFLEFVFAWRKKLGEDLLKDMMANFSVALMILPVGLIMKGIAFGLYSLVYNFSFFKPELSIGMWVFGFIACDFIMYLCHLLGHKSRFFWAAHVTHHSSLHFNFSVGIRVNLFHALYRFLFWTPLCLIGIPPLIILLHESVSYLWSVMIHTERVKKLGWLDYIFNTPSNHRVHHGSNPQYLDKNLGGILIVFDHIFGTYLPETEKPIYGITDNIYSHNPLDILLHEYKSIFNQLPKIPSWKGRLQYLFLAPGSEKWKNQLNPSPELSNSLYPSVGERTD
ncbi:MAG: sterol desaturase family protein [Algoriphagus sp.]|uniref:sterol desaturase family protein n=1 Tax=Algoriphagus sp. TaxID=1872435 RepID=UPI001822B49C|nr:sterol desaturase family protein [Algoriphagus sp.]NVJ85570.1 sterol desaturase family protein [Algoriphagus sp.]